MNIIFRSKSTGKRAWNSFMKKSSTERLKWLSTKPPLATSMINTITMTEFWYPEIGDIIVHKNRHMRKYNTCEEAYKAACDIRNYLQKAYNPDKQ